MPAKLIEYKCSCCGKIVSRSSELGRPDPGHCYKRVTDNSGNHKPHTWVKTGKIS